MCRRTRTVPLHWPENNVKAPIRNRKDKIRLKHLTNIVKLLMVSSTTDPKEDSKKIARNTYMKDTLINLICAVFCFSSLSYSAHWGGGGL